MTSPRVVEVTPSRYPGWLARFDERNAGLDDPQRIAAVETFEHDPVGIILIRRGGYAIARVVGGEIVDHKIGTAHVQGRTKKGGWSQQRYARRRAHQSDEVVERAREHAVRILLGASRGSGAGCPRTSTNTLPEVRRRSLEGLGVGGDRALVAQLLDEPRLATLRDLPRRELYDLPGPRPAVLDRAVERTRAVRVLIVDGLPNST